MLGGYDSVSAGRLWKTIYDDIGGNTGSTSAATITRRHYERYKVFQWIFITIIFT